MLNNKNIDLGKINEKIVTDNNLKTPLNNIYSNKNVDDKNIDLGKIDNTTIEKNGNDDKLKNIND